MACDLVRLTIDENGLATILLDDPSSKNAISNPVIREMAQLLQECEYNDRVKVVMLRGANSAFCGGGNIHELKEQLDGQRWDRGALGHLGDLSRRLKDMSKPTIAVIEGVVAGAGIALAMACDFSIAVEDAKFSSAFINLGLVPDTGATQLLVRTAGVCRAKEILLLSGVFTAREAAQWGMITWAVPAEELWPRVEKLCKKLSGTAPGAYRRIKTLINRSAYPDYDLNLQGEAEYQYESLISADHREGITAFLEKRRPNFC